MHRWNLSHDRTFWYCSGYQGSSSEDGRTPDLFLRAAVKEEKARIALEQGGHWKLLDRINRLSELVDRIIFTYFFYFKKLASYGPPILGNTRNCQTFRLVAFSGRVKNRRDLEVIVKEGERVGEALVPLGGGGGGSQDRGIYPLINRHSSANKRFTLLQYQDFIYKTEFFQRKK